MRTVLLGFFILMVSFQSRSQAAELGVGAIGLVVSDIDRSEKFYTEIVGMENSGGFELSKEWSAEAGMSDNRPFAVRTYRMNDNPAATTLKLAHFDKIDARPHPSGINKESGVNYLTFYYDDLEGVRERIAKAGIKIVGEVEGEGYALVIIRDPDGIFIELVEER